MLEIIVCNYCKERSKPGMHCVTLIAVHQGTSVELHRH